MYKHIKWRKLRNGVRSKIDNKIRRKLNMEPTDIVVSNLDLTYILTNIKVVHTENIEITFFHINNTIIAFSDGITCELVDASNLLHDEDVNILKDRIIEKTKEHNERYKIAKGIT